MKILLVEDHPDVQELLDDYLRSHGHSLNCAADGKSGLELALRLTHDVIVLDRMLPDMDGANLCHQLREKHQVGTPILMLTALAAPSERVHGLNVGADDYLTKPFDLTEFEARLQALHRRAQPVPAPRRLIVEDLSFDLDKQQIHRHGQLLRISPMGRCLLEILMRNAHRVVPRAELEQAIRATTQNNAQALRVHIHALRASIDGDSKRKLLHTIRGSGYRIATADEI